MQIDMFEILYPTFKFNKEITVLETFAGIGSQRKALGRIAKRKDLKINYLPPVEFDKYCIKSYNAIHGTNHKTKDITQTKGIEYSQIDLLTWSFPCQDISVAGKQKGLSKGSNTRSSLGWEVIRIIKEMKYKPKILLMENVRNLLSEQFRDDFIKLTKALEDLGYMNYHKILNAKDYGIPQNRERVFMVSILGEYNYNFPKPIPLKLRLKDMLEDEVEEKYYLSNKMIKFLDKENAEIAKTVTTANGSRMDDNFIINSKGEKFTFIESENQIGNLSGGKWDKINESCRRVYNVEKICPTLHTMQGGNTEPKILIPETTKYSEYSLKKIKENIVSGDVIGTITANAMQSFTHDNCHLIIGSTQKNASVNYDGICPALTSAMGLGGGQVPLHNYDLRIRKLTPLECTRLMGFDDEDYYKMAKVNSNSQIYKQCGNSIVVDVLEKIFEMMIGG